MWHLARRTVMAVVAISSLLFGNRAGFAQDQQASATVRVKYSSDKTELDVLKEGVKYFANRDYQLRHIPNEVLGMTFTRRPAYSRASVVIDVPADTAVYLIVDSDRGDAERIKINKTVLASGWTRISDGTNLASRPHPYVKIYRQTFSEARQVTFAPTWTAGIIVAAKHLALDTEDQKDEKKAVNPPPNTLHTDPSPNIAPIMGPTTRAANQQASIKSLEIYETDSGMMLGQTSEVVLTVTRCESPELTAVRFVTPVGGQMCLARDEALRFIRLTYPNWYVDKAEITFEDKYVAHDGGSIGAAVGTMILSVIQGFPIDSNLAITGDISANGKVRAIGGVSAKIRGATADNCTLAAVPMDNFDQLQDMVIYSGSEMVTDIQVIGISSLVDAVAVARSDRAPRLAQAIALFAEVQKDLKDKPLERAELEKKEVQEKLAKVLELAPEHLSARLLLAVAQDKLPKTLSATASRYYTFLAVRSMVAFLAERAESNQTYQVTSGVVRAGLADLHKLRPRADSNVRPLIDAWSKFIEAWSAVQQRTGSLRTMEGV
jgi:hypothetical protein